MSARRYLGTFFRGWRLYIPVLLLLVAATLVGTYYLASTQYEATARIWVDKPALDNVLDPNTPPGYVVSPGQQQADKLTQLLQTDTFVVALLKNTSASGQLTSNADQDRLVKDVRRKIAVAPLGSNTVKITFAGSDPNFCQQVVQGTIDQFRAWELTARVEQGAIEGEFYGKQLKIYEDQVNAAAKRVDDFQRDHPYPDPTSPQYLELQGMQRELESARALLNTTRTKIEQANAAASLSDTSSRVEFQILDAPAVPNRPAATLARLVEYLALGLLASFGLVFLAVAFATWQDTTIRDGDDLHRLTRAPVLGAVPHLPSDPVPGGGRPHPAEGTRAPKAAPGQLDEHAAVYPSRMTE